MGTKVKQVDCAELSMYSLEFLSLHSSLPLLDNGAGPCKCVSPLLIGMI